MCHICWSNLHFISELYLNSCFVSKLTISLLEGGCFGQTPNSKEFENSSGLKDSGAIYHGSLHLFCNCHAHISLLYKLFFNANSLRSLASVIVRRKRTKQLHKHIETSKFALTPYVRALSMHHQYKQNVQRGIARVLAGIVTIWTWSILYKYLIYLATYKLRSCEFTDDQLLLNRKSRFHVREF